MIRHSQRHFSARTRLKATLNWRLIFKDAILAAPVGGFSCRIPGLVQTPAGSVGGDVGTWGVMTFTLLQVMIPCKQPRRGGCFL